MFFVIRSNAKEFIHQKSPELKNQLATVKKQLREELSKTSNQLGYNIQGLKFTKQQWKLTHESEFIDEAEQREYEDKKAIKRSFTTI